MCEVETATRISGEAVPHSKIRSRIEFQIAELEFQIGEMHRFEVFETCPADVKKAAIDLAAVRGSGPQEAAAFAAQYAREFKQHQIDMLREKLALDDQNDSA